MKRDVQVVVSKVNVVVVSAIVILVVVLTVVTSVAVIGRINSSRNVGGERIGQRISQSIEINDAIGIAAIDQIAIPEIDAGILDIAAGNAEIIESINAAYISHSDIDGYEAGAIAQIDKGAALNIDEIANIEGADTIAAGRIELIG